MKAYYLDTNIVLRFLLQDHPSLFKKAYEIFSSAEKGECTLHLDELVMAEIVWVMSSFYSFSPQKISTTLTHLISQSWIKIPQKNVVLMALELYSNQSIAYIDCWLIIKSNQEKIPLKTFDTKLQKIASSNSL
jgi:predicted nucleic-acid-binding protein